MFFAITFGPDDEVYIYCETDLCVDRRHWMNSEQITEYEASPVYYSSRESLLSAMRDMWGLQESEVIIGEMKDVPV